MLPMATSTNSTRNLEALRLHEWGLLLTPSNPESHGWTVFGIDNGAWGAFKNKTDWEQVRPRWQRLIEEHGQHALWAVAPDIVCGGVASLEMSLRWVDWLVPRVPRVLLAVQDGMESSHLRRYLSPSVGIFVGGSTEWKKRTMAEWACLAHEFGGWCHVGRVNTARRISMCVLSQVDSFDGTSASRFSVNVPHLTTATKRLRLPFDEVL